MNLAGLWLLGEGSPFQPDTREMAWSSTVKEVIRDQACKCLVSISLRAHWLETVTWPPKEAMKCCLLYLVSGTFSTTCSALSKCQYKPFR